MNIKALRVDPGYLPLTPNVDAVAKKVVDDCKALLTPFLPHSSQRVHELLGNSDEWSGMPELREVTQEGGDPYSVLQGDYTTAATWASRPIAARSWNAAPAHRSTFRVAAWNGRHACLAAR